MAGLITNRFRITNADNFYNILSAANSSVGASRVYLYIGKSGAYSNESAPTTPTDTVQSIRYDVYRDMIAMKRIQLSDITRATFRYDWTSNTSYTQYDDTGTIFPTSTTVTSNTTYYVMTDQNNVYKCLDNNRGGRSTTKPTGTGTSIISTADNYRWKFMYNITSASALKFMTTNYIPVSTLSANDGSTQWTVQQAAANGAIHHIVISANGTGYLATSNTGFSTVTNSSVMVLKSNARSTDDIYTYSTLYLSSGLGSGQIRRIINYVGSTRTLTLNSGFTVTPNTSTAYIIGPNVIISGDSGATSGYRASAYVSNCAGGQIRKITMISSGSAYSTANASIAANTSYGTGATIRPLISPPGGHGSNPIGELGGHRLMLSVRTTGLESNTFPGNNDFRTIGLLRNPVLRSGPVANTSVIDQCMRLVVTSVSGDFTADENIVGGTSSARGKLIRFSNTNAARTAGVLRLNRITTTGTGGIFSVAETVTGSVSGKTAVVSSVTRPAVREFTGDVIYTENRTKIVRADDQIEDFKVLVKY